MDRATHNKSHIAHIGGFVQIKGSTNGLKGTLGLVFIHSTTDANFTGRNRIDIDLSFGKGLEHLFRYTVMTSHPDADDRDFGDILVARLKVRGVAGVVSDGPMRNIAELKTMDFPVFARGNAAPPSYASMIAAYAQVPIGCGGVAIFPGDIVIADPDGVVILPASIAEEVARDAVEQDRLEAYVRERIENGDSIVGVGRPELHQQPVGLLGAVREGEQVDLHRLAFGGLDVAHGALLSVDQALLGGASDGEDVVLGEGLQEGLPSSDEEQSDCCQGDAGGHAIRCPA